MGKIADIGKAIIDVLVFVGALFLTALLLGSCALFA